MTISITNFDALIGYAQEDEYLARGTFMSALGRQAYSLLNSFVDEILESADRPMDEDRIRQYERRRAQTMDYMAFLANLLPDEIVEDMLDGTKAVDSLIERTDPQSDQEMLKARAEQFAMLFSDDDDDLDEESVLVMLEAQMQGRHDAVKQHRKALIALMNGVAKGLQMHQDFEPTDGQVLALAQIVAERAERRAVNVKRAATNPKAARFMAENAATYKLMKQLATAASDFVDRLRREMDAATDVIVADEATGTALH